MCNGKCCKHRVFFDPVKKQLYYIDDDCNRTPLPIGGTLPGNQGLEEWENSGSTPTGDYPPVPHDNPLYTANDALKCAKATAMVNEMWNVIGIYQGIDDATNFLEILASVIGYFSAADPEPVSRVASASIAGLLAKIISIIGPDEIAEELESVYLNTEAKNDLICDLIDRMDTPGTLNVDIFGSTGGLKLNTLTDNDIKISIERFAELVPDNELALQLLKIFPLSSWKEIVTPKIPGTECACDGYAPTPPPQTEPGEGEFGLYAGELIGAISTLMTPAASRAASDPRGVKVNETTYAGQKFDDDINWKYDLFVMWEATETITDITFDALWKYMGTLSDGSQVLSMTIDWYYSFGSTDNWLQLAGFIGQQSHDDNTEAGMFTGGWNELKVPWDNTIPTVDARFLGLKIRFNLNKENTPDSDADWQLKINNFKIFADGSNYRATVIPMQFVPKTL